MEEVPAPPSFWSRQRAPERTESQVVFDVLFGIVLPVLCLLLDPGVFRSSETRGTATIGSVGLGVYGLFGLAALALVTWLATGRFGILLYGPMKVGAVASFWIGLWLLLPSVFLSLVGIGLLGFTPIVTGFVLWRNAERARCQARGRFGWAAVAVVGLVLAVATVLAPLWVQGYASRGNDVSGRAGRLSD